MIRMLEARHAAELDERDEMIRMIEADRAAERARHAAERARHAAELDERDEMIRMIEADRAALDGDNKRLAASDRYHSSPHSPPRSGTWTAEYRRRKAIAARYARQA